MMHTNTQRNNGFVSIVVAALLMIILALITLGFTRLMQREQRQAIDRHLSRQALYAAESGINDVAARIADPAPDPIYDANVKTTCDTNGLGPYGNGNLSADGAVAYTCALFDRTPDTLEYTTTDQQSKITELNTASGNPLDTLTINWGNSDLDPNNNLVSNLPACGFSAQDLPPARSNAPPVLKVDLTKIGARYVRSDMLRDTEYLYLMPCDGGAAPTNFAFNPTVSERGRVFQVRCTTGSTRPCSFTIDSMGAYNSNKYFLRLKPIYTGASITVEGTEVGGLPAAFNNAQVSVDMTAKAGDVVRRLRASLPIADITPDLGIPEAVLQGFDGICKQLEIVDLAAPSEVLDYCIEGFDSSTPPPPAPPAPPPASVPPGDGFSPTLADNKLFNMFHHRPGLVIVCYNQDLTTCGYATNPSYVSPMHSNMVVVGDMLYYAAQELDSNPTHNFGVGCYNYKTNTFCGFATLGATNFSSGAPAAIRGEFQAGIDNIILVNGRLYTVAIDNVGTLRMYCADPSPGTPVPCAGFTPYDIGLPVAQNTIWSLTVGLHSVGSRIYFGTNTSASYNTYLGCYDSGPPRTTCSGWSSPTVNPSVVNNTTILIGNKLCVYDSKLPASPVFVVACVDTANGNSVAPPPNFMTQPKPPNALLPNARWDAWDTYQDGNRIYISAMNQDGSIEAGGLYCYDGGIQNICPGWGVDGWADGSQAGNDFSTSLVYDVTRVGTCLYGVGHNPVRPLIRMSPATAGVCP